MGKIFQVLYSYQIIAGVTSQRDRNRTDFVGVPHNGLLDLNNVKNNEEHIIESDQTEGKYLN